MADGMNEMFIIGRQSSKSTLGANIRTHLVDALPELLEWKGVTDDVLHGELTSGDHGDCLNMGMVIVNFLAYS